MCDYSLRHVKSRSANVGDKLRVHNFGTGTRGFIGETDNLDADGGPVAVCLLPGTELAFDRPIEVYGRGLDGAPVSGQVDKTVARFTQVNKAQPNMHHDALEVPGEAQPTLLTFLTEGQTATVLQLPAAPKTKEEAAAQTRAEYIG